MQIKGKKENGRGRQTDRHTDRDGDRQTGKQTHTYVHERKKKQYHIMLRVNWCIADYQSYILYILVFVVSGRDC